MRAQTWLAPLALSISACGPEPGVVPRSGVYDVTSEIATNDCPRAFEDTTSMDAIVFADETLTLGFADFLIHGASGWLSSHIYTSFERDPEGDGFIAPASNTFFATWFEFEGCRYRRNIAVEALGGDVIHSSLTYEWMDAGACEWLDASQTRCTMVRDDTYTLREACDGCDLDEIQDRVRMLLAAKDALPK